LTLSESVSAKVARTCCLLRAPQCPLDSKPVCASDRTVNPIHKSESIARCPSSTQRPDKPARESSTAALAVVQKLRVTRKSAQFN
jgi:hypothetical protein